MKCEGCSENIKWDFCQDVFKDNKGNHLPIVNIQGVDDTNAKMTTCHCGKIVSIEVEDEVNDFYDYFVVQWLKTDVDWEDDENSI